MKKQGFTLVELLVVITIIGMLVSMLLPAVQSAREAGRRNTCLNNQKNLTLATQNYESARGAFPGYVNRVVNPHLGQSVAASWVMVLLPYLDRNDLWQLWSDGTPAPTTGGSATTVGGFISLKLLLCPSDPPVSSGKGETHLSYHVNCGYRDVTTGSFPGLDRVANDPTPVLPGDPSPAVGVFHNHYLYDTTTSKYTGRRVSADYMTSKDGTSTTWMLSEGKFEDFEEGFLLASSWVLPNGNSTVMTVNEAAGNSPGLAEERTLGFTIPCMMEDSSGSSTAGSGSWTALTYDPAAPKTLINNALGAPSSYHPGVVVASFCDGHAQTLSDTMDQTVYMHLATPDGERAYRETLDTTNKPSLSNSWFRYFKPDDVGVLDESEIQ